MTQVGSTSYSNALEAAWTLGMNYSLVNDLFGSWNAILHTLITGTLTYFGLIFWLRISGKRTLSKWNSFDFVVTVAFGSILASALLTGSTSFAQAMVGIGLLVGFQFLLTWLSVRTPKVQMLIKAKPTLLLYKGKLLEDTLKQKRIAKGEVLAAIRSSGHAQVESIDAVVLETNGNVSIMSTVDSGSALEDVEGFSERA